MNITQSTDKMKECLMILEKERYCFIKANYAKISCLVGLTYWDDEKKENREFWNHDENRVIMEPYEFSICALSELPHRMKQSAMFNTYSYSPLLRMDEIDKKRLSFDAVIMLKLISKQTISEDELNQLMDEHEFFITRWNKE